MTNRNIDILEMTEDELRTLNHRIVERIKFLVSFRTHEEMMRFSPGDKVSFLTSDQDLLTGTLIKFNKKTVTVITETGQRWNVPPHILISEDVKKEDGKHSDNVIQLPRKED